MAIQDIWLKNLQYLVDKEGNGDKRKGLRSVADLSGLSEEYLYQLVERKPNKDGLAREVGKIAAKKIANAFSGGRPDDWFDTLQTTATTSIAGTIGTSQSSGSQGDMQAAVAQALSTIAQWVASTDDLTRDQIKPLVNRMFDEPQRSAEIASRIGSTLQNASPTPAPHGLQALLANKTKK